MGQMSFILCEILLEVSSWEDYRAHQDQFEWVNWPIRTNFSAPISI